LAPRYYGQRAVLASLRALFHIEDVLCGTSVHMKLFADDVKLYTSFSHPSRDLQIVCDKLTSWSEQWRCELPGTSAMFTDLVIVSCIIIKVTRLMAQNCLGQTRLVILELCLTTS